MSGSLVINIKAHVPRFHDHFGTAKISIVVGITLVSVKAVLSHPSGTKKVDPGDTVLPCPLFISWTKGE
jgi:hypothetical protein